jgi:hypothetical protein
MASPVGLQIGNDPRKPTHRIGKLIGTGACSSVHELEVIDGGSVEKFVIKLTPIPPPKKSSKRKPTPIERNANLLSHETLMYKVQLNKLHGKYIPYLPPAKGPPQSGDVDGKRANSDFLGNTSFDHVLFLTIALSYSCTQDIAS